MRDFWISVAVVAVIWIVLGVIVAMTKMRMENDQS